MCLNQLNILVNSANRALLTDFGSARLMESKITPQKSFGSPNHCKNTGDQFFPQIEIDDSGAIVTLTGPAWTLRWAAPELLDGRLPSLKSDIWAFGWICWEVCDSWVATETTH